MKPKVSTSFGQWLKKRRKTLDLTQAELAKRVGCAVITIQKIEADQRQPSKQMAGLLAEHLNIPDEARQEFVRFAREESGLQRLTAFDELSRRALRSFSPFQMKNIPTPPTLLIGRDQDVAAARKRLLDGDTRLLTILGPPGVGKTRLAIQVASDLREEFEQGVHFVSLAPVNDSNLVAATIAQALGVNQIGERSFSDRLKEYLRDKHALLALDNFEQVVAAARLVAELLSACPWISILVTSRAPLSIRGERRFPVSPLTLPAEENENIDPSELMRYSAIELFVERAQAVNPDFVLRSENANVVAAICKHLDGLPLAIELVSARIDFLPPQTLLEQLGGSTMLHANGLGDVSDRHRTLYHAIDWSYTLLTAGEQTLLTRLSVFHGGWTLEAARGIMPEYSTSDIQEALRSLVSNHLVLQYKYHDQPRFALLETVRAYALERLAETGAETDIRQRHAEYYLALAEEADSHLRTSAQMVWLDRLEAERGNLRAALAWFIDQVRDAESGLRLAGALAWFWTMRCHLSEGREWSTRALQIGSDISPVLRARALFGSGSIAWLQGDVSAARALMEECVALYRNLGLSQRWNLAWALTGLAMIAAYQADYEATHATAEEAIVVARQVSDEWMIALALCAGGEGGMMRQDYAAARSCFKESSRIFRKTGDMFGLGIALLDWGYMDSIQGNYEKAHDRLAESIAMFRNVGERWMRAIALNILGQVVQQQGDCDQATVYYSESLDLLRKMGLETSIADVLFSLAQLVRAQGHFVLAKRLYEECLTLFLKQGNEAKAAECRAGLTAAGDELEEVNQG
jgi:predicted ATPase/DNA-binding XRE family transcriptional regulator